MSEGAGARGSYDAVAARYAAEMRTELDGKPLDRALLDLMTSFVGAGPVADIGCGPGHVAAYLNRGTVRPVGIDLSPAMCAIALRSYGIPAAAGDMLALPLAASTIGAIVCFYAVIHLIAEERRAAYAELRRVLRPGGHLLLAFHVRDGEVGPGEHKTFTQWLGQDVDLTFRFLDPVEELDALAGIGLEMVARIDRRPYPGVEHPSDRSYLLLRKP